ncbi:MAG: CHRD domain-containing protein, partial [bacterium]
GNLYINIHTSSNQPGEIRGQIGEQMFFAALDTAQSIPPPAMASSASGTGVVRLNPAMNAAKFDLTVCDLTGPLAAAHFHNGAAGATGGVVRTITNDFDGNTATGVWLTTDMEPLNEQMVSELQAGNLYFNIHTAANQPGEIRGQVNPASLITSVERLPGLTNIPREFDLFQNFPNPFNPATEIRFNLRQASRTILRIFNMVGQEVATPLDAHLEAGAYKVTFDAKRLPSGVYMYRLESLGLVEVRKMILLK